MKKTFYNLPEKKRNRIIEACVKEFAKNGYYKSSVDRIISIARISKGGIYEYISSKKELFLYITNIVYGRLYDYIKKDISQKGTELPDDILRRFHLVAGIAFEFYVSNIDYVRFIVNNYIFKDESLEKKVRSIFVSNFQDVFGSVDDTKLRFSKERVTELLVWMLMKTRYDFLQEYDTTKDITKLKEKYLHEWDFYLEVLSKGIYL